MAVTCEQVAELLDAGGTPALADRPDAQAHIGACEICADRLIAVDELEASAQAPLAPTPAETAAEVPAETAAEVPAETRAEVPAETRAEVPAETRAEVPAPPVPKPADTTAPPELPSSTLVKAAVPPPPGPTAASVGTTGPPPSMPAQSAATSAKPAAPPESAPQEEVAWLPSVLPPVGPTDAEFGGRRGYIQIKPTHLALGAAGSAMIGGLIVLATVLLVQRLAWSPSPAEESVDSPVEYSQEDVSIDFVPLLSAGEDGADSSEDDQPSKRTSGGRKRKRKDKHERGPASAVVLSKTDISDGIKANLSKLGSCFKAARKRKELTPGRHPIVVDFRVLPNGSVQNAVVTGPDYLVKKRLAKCLATKLRSWRFPASAKGFPVRDLQLPITVR